MTRWLMLAMCVLAFAAAAAESQQVEKEKVIVLSVVAGDDGSKQSARLVEEQILTELGASGRFEVMGQSELGTLLGLERQKTLLGCSGGECLVELGGSLNARFAVMGSLGRFGTKLRLDLKVSDMRSGQVLRRSGQVIERDDDLFPAVTAQLRALQMLSDPQAVSAARSSGSWALVAGGAGGAVLGGVLMVVSSGWAADLNAPADPGVQAGLNLSLAEARGRLGFYQVLYWGGAALVAAGVATAVLGVVRLLRQPAVPAGTVGVTVAATPFGLEVRW